MKVTNRFGLSCVVALSSAAAFASDPLSTQVLEEVVAAAENSQQQPVMEEIVVTAQKPQALRVELTELAGLTDEIAFEPEIRLSL